MIKQIIKSWILAIRRFLTPSVQTWIDCKTPSPLSHKFGFDLGTPIDRFYTNVFFEQNRRFIQGKICEIADNSYTLQFGTNISESTILHIDHSNPKATLVGDLTKSETLPFDYFDCFICTVTLNFIYDYKKAIEGIYQTLKGGGVALITVAGLIQVSRYDYERWGDYWRFTDMSILKVTKEIFGENVKCTTYGIVLSATAELHGIPAEKLTHNELMYQDKDYQILITLVAQK